jgi:hypothetical protein
VQFQATGKNLRITNLYASVSSQTNQAVCTIYKGQVGPPWSINGTNSGSTGAPASGAITLLDGESIYVVWTGGDVGATATATFSGVAVPFDVADNATDLFVWDDPIAAGDGSLIFPAIKSPNYQAGLAGWIIRRDGTFELSGGTFRGTLSIIDPITGRGFIISPTLGTMALVPPNSNVGLTTGNGELSTGLSDDLALGFAILQLQSPSVNGLQRATMTMFSQRADGTPAQINLGNNVVAFTTLDVLGHIKGSNVVANIGTQTSSPPIGATETVVLTTPVYTWEAFRSYKVTFTGSVASNTNNTDALLRVRKENGTTPPTGQQLSVGRFACRNAGSSYDATWSTYFTVAATPVTCAISLTLGANPSVGQTVTISAAATSPAELTIEEDGNQILHLSAAQLV